MSGLLALQGVTSIGLFAGGYLCVTKSQEGDDKKILGGEDPYGYWSSGSRLHTLSGGI